MQVWDYRSLEAFECADSAFSSTADQYAACVRLREVGKEVGRKKKRERDGIFIQM